MHESNTLASRYGIYRQENARTRHLFLHVLVYQDSANRYYRYLGAPLNHNDFIHVLYNAPVSGLPGGGGSIGYIHRI
jgi:hypothetical protein